MNENHPAFNDYIEVAFILKAKGFDGTFSISLNDHYLKDLKASRTLFLMFKGNMLPFFITKLKASGDEYQLNLKDVKSKDFFTDIYPKKVYLHKNEVTVIEEEESWDELENFQCFNRDLFLGSLIKIEEFPQQDMAFVSYQDREILIPLVDALIVEIDHENQKIIFDLPEGFLDLN